MTVLLSELREAIHQLRRAPGFSALAVAVLAVGLGASVAVFSLLHSIVLRPLPFAAPDRLVGVQAVNAAKALVQDAVSASDARDFAARARSFSSTGALRPNFASFTRPGEPPERLVTALVTPGWFETLGISPQLGRRFAGDDFSLRGTRTVILGHRFWQRQFHGRADVLGQTLQLDDEACTVIGVMPETFREPAFVDAWLPFPDESGEYFARDSRFWTMVGRLAPGVSAGAASAELRAIAADLARSHPETNRDWSAAAVPLHELRTGGLRSALLLLAGAVGILVLVTCLNLANLLLARGLRRRAELGVRLALGATPRRLAMRVLLESLVLSAAGALLGTALAALILPLAAHRLPPGLLPRSTEIALHAPMLAVAAGLSLIAGLACGVLPAWHALRLDPNVLLKDGGRASAGAGGAARWPALLVGGQIALTVTVLAAALLLMKSLVRLQNVPPGFDPRGVVTVRLAPPPLRYETSAELAQYYDRLLAAAAAVPGVAAVAVNASAPMSGITLTYPTWPDDRDPGDAAAARDAVYAPVSERYLDTIRLPLRAGRWFNAHDRADGAPVAVVNETYARLAFPGGNAVGRRVLLLPWMGRTFREIVGVVADARQDDLASPPPPQVYVPQQQMPWFFSTLLVRLERPGVLPAVRAAVQAVDPTLPFTPAAWVDDIAGTATQPRLYTWLFTFFAGTSAALTAFGIYANLRFALGQRVREIGLRLALGATPGGILAWVLQRHGRPVWLGLFAGLAGAVPLALALRSRLYGVGPFDPWIGAALPLLVVGVALLAALPATLAAARLSPAVALQRD